MRVGDVMEHARDTKGAFAARLTTSGARPGRIEPPNRQPSNQARIWQPDGSHPTPPPQTHVEPHVLQSRVAASMATGPSLRCFVIGHDETQPNLGSLNRVTNPEAAFDVIVSLGATGPSMLAQHLSEVLTTGSNPAAPLICCGPHADARADVVLADASAASIAAAIASVNPIKMRIKSLPRIDNGPDRSRLLALTLAYTRGKALEAKWTPGARTMIGYPLLLGIAEQRPMLEDLANDGLLRRHFFDRAFVCAHCSSSRLMAREVCVKCRSSHIEEQALLHHYPCGYQAPEERFRAERGGYHCPKCSKDLRHYGQDYDKPGTVSKCCACHEHNAEPEAFFTCADCNHNQPCDGTARQTWFHYELTPDGVAAVKAGTVRRGGPNGSSTASPAARSLRDFRLVSRQLITLSSLHSRPLSAFRMTIDMAQLQAAVGAGNVAQVCLLAQEVAAQSLCESDIFASVDGGLVACLPETDQNETLRVTQHITAAIATAIKQPLALHFETQHRADAVSTLFRELL